MLWCIESWGLGERLKNNKDLIKIAPNTKNPSLSRDFKYNWRIVYFLPTNIDGGCKLI